MNVCLTDFLYIQALFAVERKSRSSRVETAVFYQDSYFWVDNNGVLDAEGAPLGFGFLGSSDSCEFPPNRLGYDNPTM
jgi:hypothetical protein